MPEIQTAVFFFGHIIGVCALYQYHVIMSEWYAKNISKKVKTGIKTKGMKRRDRKAKSQKPNGMGAADERLQGTGRGSCESGIDIRLSEEVRAENCSDVSHIFQSCGRIVHKYYGII